MSLSTLESLVKSPDLWDFSLNAQNMRDVLIEIASRVDSLANSRKIRSTQPTETENHIGAEELDEVNARIDDTNQQIERQSKDFTTELRDLKEFFNFQLRDLRENLGHRMANMKRARELGTSDDGSARNSSRQDLANEVFELQDKLRAVIAAMGDMKPVQQIPVDGEEDAGRLLPIEIGAEGEKASQRPEEGEVTESGRQTVSQPVSPRQSPEPALSQRISRDPRVDWMQPIVDQLKADRKNDLEKLNTTIRTVNKLIVELEAQKQKLDENVEVTKGFASEFERLYTKMAEVAVDQDKKVRGVADALSARDEKSGQADMTAVQEMMKKMKNVIQDNLEIMDQNYKREIRNLKKEIATLKKGQGIPVDETADEEPEPLVFDRGLRTPSSRDAGEGKDGYARRIVVREIDFPDSVQYCEAIVQTEESEMKPIPVFRTSAMTFTKLPGVIVTHEIVDRDPVKVGKGRTSSGAIQPAANPSDAKSSGRQQKEEGAEGGDGMAFMEKYTVDEEDKEMKKFVFGPQGKMSCERMLELTIVSDYDAEQAFNAPAVVQQVLEDQYNMTEMKNRVDRHHAQISSLAMDVYDLHNPQSVEEGRCVVATLTSPRLAENLDFNDMDQPLVAVDMDVVDVISGRAKKNDRFVSNPTMTQSLGAIPVQTAIQRPSGQGQQGKAPAQVEVQPPSLPSIQESGPTTTAPVQGQQPVVIPGQGGQTLGQVVAPTQGQGQIPVVMVPAQGGQAQGQVVMMPAQGGQGQGQVVMVPAQGGQSQGQVVMVPVQGDVSQGQVVMVPAQTEEGQVVMVPTQGTDDKAAPKLEEGQVVMVPTQGTNGQAPVMVPMKVVAPTDPQQSAPVLVPITDEKEMSGVPVQGLVPGQVVVPVQGQPQQVVIPTQGEGQVVVPIAGGGQVMVPVQGTVVTEGTESVPSMPPMEGTSGMEPLPAGKGRGRTLSSVDKPPLHVLNPTPFVPGSSSGMAVTGSTSSASRPDKYSKVDMSIQTAAGKATPPKSPVRTRRGISPASSGTSIRLQPSPKRGMGMVLVVNADTPPQKARLRVDPDQAGQGGVQAADVDAVNDRLDQIDSALSSLEYQLYNLQKSVINEGAMRPNSAGIDDGRPYASCVPSKRHGSRGNSPSRGHREKPSEDRRRSKQESKTGQASAKEKDGLNELLEIKDKPKAIPAKEQPTSAKDSSRVQYQPLVPGSLQAAKDQQKDPKAKQMVFADSLSIDPDFEQVQVIQESQKPEEISIPKYEDQLRILREAVVELRTNMQMLKVKSEQPVMLPSFEPMQAAQEQEGPAQTDDAMVRALRRKLDAHLLDFQSQIQDLRRELYEFMARPVEKVIEKVIEEKPAEPEKEPEPEKKLEKDAPPVKDFNVEMNILKAKAFLGDFDEDRVMKITNLGEIPDLDVMDSSHRDKKLIIEEPRGAGVSVPKPLLQPAKPGAPPSEGDNNRDKINPHAPIPALPARAPTRNEETQEFVGRDIPQVIEDLRVLNSVPKDKLLEALLPYIVNLRADLQLQIENAQERLRRLELAVPMKIDKEFVDAFFRKIRLALQETNDKVIKIAAAMPDKVSQDDVEERIAEALKVMAPQDTTAGGKSTYTCLLCGAKRTGISNPSHTRRGHIFKGRAAPASALGNTESGPGQLPPLRGDDS